MIGLAQSLQRLGYGRVGISGKIYPVDRTGGKGFSELFGSHDRLSAADFSLNRTICHSFVILSVHTVNYYTHFSGNVNKFSIKISAILLKFQPLSVPFPLSDHTQEAYALRYGFYRFPIHIFLQFFCVFPQKADFPERKPALYKIGSVILFFLLHCQSCCHRTGHRHSHRCPDPRAARCMLFIIRLLIGRFRCFRSWLRGRRLRSFRHHT